MDFSYPSACSQGCFVVCSWNIWSKPLTRPNCTFSPRLNQSETSLHSWITWLLYARPNGWSTPSGLSPGPEQVLDYVGRYTHRVAISNNRLLDIAEDKVTFRYKDYRHDAQQKTMTVEAEEFIRRFLLHVLPEGFQRIRYYGFLANRYREEKLARCRELLDMPAPEPPALEGAKDYRERYQELIGPSFGECPLCHQGRMLVIEILPRSPHRKTATTDTS
jgi:Putative transposase